MNILQEFTEFIDYIIESFSTPIYYLLVVLIYLIYIITAIGIVYINPEYAIYLQMLTNLRHRFGHQSRLHGSSGQNRPAVFPNVFEFRANVMCSKINNTNTIYRPILTAFDKHKSDKDVIFQ